MENYNSYGNSSEKVTDREAVFNPWKVRPEDLTKDDSGNVIPKTYIQDADEAHDLANTANRLRDESMDKMTDSIHEEPYDKDKMYESGKEGINWTVGTAGSVLDLMGQLVDSDGLSTSSVPNMEAAIASLKEKNTISDNEYENDYRALGKINKYVNNNLVRCTYPTAIPNAVNRPDLYEFWDVDTGAKRATDANNALIITPDDIVKYAKSEVESIKEARQKAAHDAGDRAVAEVEHDYDYNNRMKLYTEKIQSAKEQLGELTSDDKETE